MPSTSEHSDTEASKKATHEVAVEKNIAVAAATAPPDETQSNTSGVKSTAGAGSGAADDAGKGMSGSNNSADDEREREPTPHVKTRVVPTVEATQNGALPTPHKRGGATRIAAAMQALSWDQSDVTGDSQQAGVGDFTRVTEGGSAPKGKRGGRRSTDSDGRRRRSGDSEGGRRRKSGDNEGRRRRSGDARRSSDSRKSGEHRRSTESRRNSESQGSTAPQPEGEQLPQITDVLLARLITSLSDSTLGNPALLLQSLLGFSPDDYNDLLAALSESRLSYVDIIAAYLHNIRVMSEDSGSSSAALSGTLTRSLIEQYNNLLVQALKSPRPAMKAPATGTQVPGMMVKPPIPPSMTPNPRMMSGTNGGDAGLPRGPSGLGFGRRSLDSLRQQRQNFAMTTSMGMPAAVHVNTKPVPRPGQRKSYSGDMPANPSGYQAPPPPPYQQGAPPPPAYPSTPTPPPFPSTPPPPYGGPGVPGPPPYQATPPPPPTYAATPATTVYPTAPPPGFQTTPPPVPAVMPQGPQQIEQYATYLSNARLASVGMVQGMTPRLLNNPMLAGSSGLDFGGPGLVAGVAGIPVPSNWRNSPVLANQQEISSWAPSQPAAANPGQTCAPGWHGTLPVVQEHERMDQNAGYQTG
ncbi:hypothetical protein BSKO_00053 [Bryopsis sp. KO-2023]|nr:hypothetical protein BSKO_00053 [Bryopsis sp. KO-2023]